MNVPLHFIVAHANVEVKRICVNTPYSVPVRLPGVQNTGVFAFMMRWGCRGCGYAGDGSCGGGLVRRGRELAWLDVGTAGVFGWIGLKKTDSIVALQFMGSQRAGHD